ncbi:MAG: hypothetical protein FGM32_01980 [Candidatus Kapabacteria bacterium]|nr:hypothetical protein [Candidatus Kapabacteria bacterium]
MTNETLSAYERYTDHLEELRRAEAEWASTEYWIETLVELCRDRGDDAGEQFLRDRLLAARLHREVAVRSVAEIPRFSATSL